ASRTDQRIDLVLTEAVHNLRHKDTRRGTTAERNHSQNENAERLDLQKGLGRKLGPHGQPKRDGYDVDQSVARGISQAVYHSALTQQVAERKHTNQRSRIRQ